MKNLNCHKSVVTYERFVKRKHFVFLLPFLAQFIKNRSFIHFVYLTLMALSIMINRTEITKTRRTWCTSYSIVDGWMSFPAFASII